MPLFPCDNRDRCGCDRSVAGLASSKASTTFMAVDRDHLDPDTYRALFRAALEREQRTKILDLDEIDEMVDWHIRAASQCPSDVVLRVKMSE